MAFMAGIVAEHETSWSVPAAATWSAAVLAMLLLMVGIFRRRHWEHTPLVSLLLFFTLGLVAGHLDRPELPYPPSLEPFFENQQTPLIGRVSSPLDFYPDRSRLTVQLEAAIRGGQSHPIAGGILLTLGMAPLADANWVPGDELLFRANLRPFRNFNNPGGFDYIRSQAEQGLFARAYLADERFMVKLRHGTGAFPGFWLQEAREGLERFRQGALIWLQYHLPPDEAAFYAGLLLGYRNLLSDSWREHLNRAGVTHLLSISGLHLGLVSLLVFGMVRWLIRLLYPAVLQRLADKRLAVFPALLAAASYALVAGFGAPPIWRSMIMLTICFGAAYWYLAPDPFSVLAASALLILLVAPNSLWQVSFQLTFLCMFAIFILYPKFKPVHLTSTHPGLTRTSFPGRFIAPFEEAFWLSVAVNILILPLTAYYFHGISAAGCLANIFLVPLTGFLVLPTGLVSLLIYAVNESLAVPLLQVGGWFLKLFEALVIWFSQLSWSYFWVGRFSLLTLLALYAGLAMLLCPWRWRLKAIGLAAMLSVSSIVSLIHSAQPGFQQPGMLVVTALDVAQGTATLVCYPDGTTMLVDGGGFHSDSFDMGRAVLAPFLWHSGIRKLDYVVLSHDHPDHRNGLRFILSHFDVGWYWESGLTEAAGGVSELAGIAAKRRIPVKTLGDLFGTHSIDGCELRVTHPNPGYLAEKWDRRNLNNASLVLHIVCGRTSVVLPGDIDQSVEAELFRDQPSSDQLLLFSPHHGSAHSNSAWLFDALRPQAVIFSCGYHNPFGLPSPAVLAECAKRGIPYFRTDYDGAIRGISDGNRWKVEPVKTSSGPGQFIDDSPQRDQRPPP